MIRVLCCVCNKQYATKDDGQPGELVSHGYCETHYDEAMLAIKSQFAELPADRPHAG